jgi:hypothetical protein
MDGPRTGCEWLCHTDEVTDTRHREPRPRGLSASTAAEPAAITDGRPICPFGAAPEQPVALIGASFGGWTADVGAWGGSRRTGEEVR